MTPVEEPGFLPWPENVQPVNKGKWPNQYRVYPTDAGHLPGVTSINKVLGLGKTDALTKWAADQEHAAVIEAVKITHERSPNLVTAAFVQVVEHQCGTARKHVKELAKAADVGRQIHDMIEYSLSRELGLPGLVEPVMSDEASIGYIKFDDWWKQSGLKPVRMEQFVCDPDYGYAGTVDLIAEGPDGYELLDWKSSKYIYDEQHVQVGAYVRAASRFARITRARLVRLPKSLENLAVEVVELGHLYGGRTLTQEQLFTVFRNNLETWKLLAVK